MRANFCHGSSGYWITHQPSTAGVGTLKWTQCENKITPNGTNSNLKAKSVRIIFIAWLEHWIRKQSTMGGKGGGHQRGGGHQKGQSVL